jgi:hypothetical protein
MAKKKSTTHKRTLHKSLPTKRRKARWDKAIGIATIIVFVLLMLLIMVTLVFKYYHLLKYHP